MDNYEGCCTITLEWAEENPEELIEILDIQREDYQKIKQVQAKLGLWTPEGDAYG